MHVRPPCPEQPGKKQKTVPFSDTLFISRCRFFFHPACNCPCFFSLKKDCRTCLAGSGKPIHRILQNNTGKPSEDRVQQGDIKVVH